MIRFFAKEKNVIPTDRKGVEESDQVATGSDPSISTDRINALSLQSG